ncbi:SRPBCC family protein [Nocardia sp. NBC_00881]|uniref:SRPBCC family protein n=1 Tax=Nocardia sp. NBC_00881 TaxID=2975995 RepID=UPI0038704B1F|nr:SRPBCC family protein [Nocardia sp. NBC_00881]
MTTFENALTINRPIADVFAYLAQFENVPRWNYAITETRKTSAGPVGVGSTYRQTRSIPEPAVEAFEVTEFQPTQRLQIRGQLGRFPAVLSYDLESAPGGTMLRNVIDLELRGPLRLASPIVTAQVKSAVAANLDVLRQLLET